MCSVPWPTTTARSERAAAEALHSYAVNFSVGGICLRTERSYPVGHLLQLVLLVDERGDAVLDRWVVSHVVTFARPGCAVEG